MKPGLDRLAPRLLDGSETFRGTTSHQPLQLIDYWRWSASTLMDNVARGVLAEFVVAAALRDNLPEGPRLEWENYDLEPTINGRKLTIEVKSSAKVQSWQQKNYSDLAFRVKSTEKWDPATGESLPPKRADVYVFCALTGTEIESHLDALDLDNWEFRVILGRLLEQKQSIAWSTVAGLGAVTCRFADLAERIAAAARDLD